ncbi:MAG: efflux RND transporter periplasmic adaptor subunit [Phycisphaerales bacterium]|nr:efflux RND transporter periplasmic adaptor subunit [Phycisphaerales bacterium]
MKKQTIVAAVLVLGGVFAVGGSLAWWKYREIEKARNQPPMPEPPESVQVVEAQTVTWQPTARLSGTVVALQSVVLKNEVAGTVREVRFESGQRVKQGDILVTLDDSTEQADLAAAEATRRVAEASIVAAKADLAWSEANYNRMLQASEARVAPIADVDRARSELEGNRGRLARAEAELEQAQAQVLQVKTLIDKKTIRAPFDALVGLRNIHPGQYLAEGSEIAGLQAVSDRIYLDFALPQDQAFRVKPGDVVMANADVLGPNQVRIEVVALDAVANATTRNIRVRSIVENTGQILRPGMFVDVSVPVGTSGEFVAVPITAVRRASYGDHLFIVLPGEKPGELRARQRFVRLGPSLGQQVIVAEGIKPGERVAAEGSFKLRENSLVMPAGAAPTTATAPPGSTDDPADAGEAHAAAPAGPGSTEAR